jgi:hypothetical protein
MSRNPSFGTSAVERRAAAATSRGSGMTGVDEHASGHDASIPVYVSRHFQAEDVERLRA